MITEEEISHQNNNIFELSHPSVGWADTNTNITFCSGRGSTANSSHRAPSWATLSAGDPEFIMASCHGTRRTAARNIS